MLTPYVPRPERYSGMKYLRCGKSGLRLSRVSLGFWHNFGDVNVYANCREMVLGAFDLGITSFDLANNYGPCPGSAEETFGRIVNGELRHYRDEMVISSKAGYRMWDGPYGDGGSRKYLMASLDQSLRRMGLDYVDIFYHHRPDPETPLEETMGALADIVRSGKALYAGISNYPADLTRAAARIMRSLGVPLLIHQPSHSMLNRWPEDGLLDALAEEGMGCIAFSPLAQGLLTDRYFRGVPADSRAGGASVFLQPDRVTPELLAKTKALNAIAARRGQTLAQMALAWVLRGDRVTTVLIGASRLAQIQDNVKAVDKLDFAPKELDEIETILKKDA